MKRLVVSGLFRNPISKNGDIRYFEILKISFVLSLVFGLFTLLTEKVINPFSESSFLIANILLCLITALMIVTLVYDSKEFIAKLKSYVLRQINQSIPLKIEFPLFALNLDTYVVFHIKAIHLRHRVMRC